MATDKTEGASRRDFLKLGVAAPAAAAVATAGSAQEPQQVNLSSTTLQDTAHTRAYLDSARF